MPKTITEQIEEALTGILTPSGIEQWWDIKIPHLYDHTPRELVAAGDSAAVLDLVRHYRDEAFS